MSSSTKTVQDPQVTQALRLTIGGTKKRFPSQTFSDDHKMDELREEIVKSSAQVKVFLRTVCDWPPKQRLHVLSFLASVKDNIRFFVGDQQPSHDNLLDAVLALPCDTSNTSQREQVKRMVIEAAATCRPDVLESSADQILARLKELGIKRVTRETLVSDAENLRDQINEQRQIARLEGTTIREVLPDAPVSTLFGTRVALLVDVI